MLSQFMLSGKIIYIINKSRLGINLDDVYKKHQVISTHNNHVRNMDRSITQENVDGCVEVYFILKR